MRWPIVARTTAQLRVMASPGGAKSEAIPYVLYDTQTYPAAGTAALTFFLTQQADPTLSNLATAGQLSQPQWLEIHGIFLDFLSAPVIRAAGAAATLQGGQLDDIELILKQARMTGQLEIAQKNYGLQPGTFFHASGGGVGFYAGAFTAATAVNQGNNGIQGQTWAPNGSIIIPPTQNFSFTLRFQPVLVPSSAAVLLRVSLAGVLHRAVR